MLWDTFSGNILDLKVGTITLVDIVFAAVRIRSGSRRILGRFGAINAKMPTRSSDLDWLTRSSLSAVSENPIGLVVNIAVRSRRNKSCSIS